MTTKIYFNEPTMNRLGRRTKTAAGNFIDAEVALRDAHKAENPAVHLARERLAVERLKDAKQDLLDIIADIDKAIALANI